jgi:hypothetical protein
MAKGKGSGFEREMCRALSLWWSDGERDDVFWRSAGSGAMAKTRSKIGKNTFGQYGDIQAVDPIGQPLLDLCVIELKRGYSHSTFADSLDKKKGAALQGWEKFIVQVLADQKNAKTPYWMLITRRDRRETLVFMDDTMFMHLRQNGMKWYRAGCQFTVRFQGIKVDAVVVPLEEFFRLTTSTLIKEVLKGTQYGAR